MNPFIFMPECLPENKHHLVRYTHFIWSRLFRTLPEGTYTEKHHIVPKSFGMNKDYISQPWNIVKLSAKEHYIAHMMLWKAFGYQMTFAFMKMSLGHTCPSSLYSKLKIDCSTIQKKRYATGLHPFCKINSNNTGANNPLYGKKRPQWLVDHIVKKNRIAWANKPQSEKDEINEKLSLLLSGSNNPFYGQKHTEETRLKMSGSRPGFSGAGNHFFGKTHSTDVIKLISDVNKLYVWITDGVSENKRILKSEGIPNTMFSGKLQACYTDLLCIETGKIYATSYLFFKMNGIDIGFNKRLISRMKNGETVYFRKLGITLQNENENN
jgi:hypothetical protein